MVKSIFRKTITNIYISSKTRSSIISQFAFCQCHCICNFPNVATFCSSLPQNTLSSARRRTKLPVQLQMFYSRQLTCMHRCLPYPACDQPNVYFGSPLIPYQIGVNRICSFPIPTFLAPQVHTRPLPNWRPTRPIYQPLAAGVSTLHDSTSSGEAMSKRQKKKQQYLRWSNLESGEVGAKRFRDSGANDGDSVSRAHIEDNEADANPSRENKLLHRKWRLTELGEAFKKHYHKSCNPNYLQFTLATYNVLAQNLLEDNSYLYDRCQNEWLYWPFRQIQLLAEFTLHQPDIFCCQEVNEKHYEEFFRPSMEELGYKGEFKKRTRSMHDGCATFYKTSVFECESVVPIEYLKPGVPVLDRDNIALLLLLRPKRFPNTETRLCVANTHLLFNPRRGDVKLAQLMLLFAEIDRLTYRGEQLTPAGTLPTYHPILFCGDLNMEPFSQLYRFVSSGTLPLNGLTVRKLSGQERSWNHGADRPLSSTFLDPRVGITDASQFVDTCVEREYWDSSSSEKSAKESEKEVDSLYTQGSGTLTHRLGFRSVYRHYMEYGTRQYKHRVREVTTSHSRANSTVDYIFYSSGIADDSIPRTGTASDPASVKSEENNSSNSVALDDRTSDGYFRWWVTDGSAPESTGNSSHQATVNTDRLQLLAHLELLSDREMKQIGGLPNECISSDHLILSAKFAMKCDDVRK